MRMMHGGLNGGERYTYSRYKEWEIEREAKKTMKKILREEGRRVAKRKGIKEKLNKRKQI